MIRIGRPQYRRVRDLALEFDQLFETLVANQTGGKTLLDFSHIQIFKHRASGAKFELAHWPEPDVVIEACLERYQPRGNETVYDLGTRCGISTFALSNMARIVVALEPDAQRRTVLGRNVNRLAMTNVMLADEGASSFADMIQYYGVPTYCKVNLDSIALDFFRDSPVWKALPLHFAVVSRSKEARDEFGNMLRQNGFETESDNEVGVLWAKPGGR